ncbi:MAG: hypothetical protein ACK5ME_01330 [Parahaliea sp.]
MRKSAIRGLPPIIFCLVLASCKTYDIFVNDTVLYTPRPLFTNYTMVDPALQDCVKSAIDRYKVSEATQLQILSCSDMGINTLTGLAVFTGLRQLNLSDNALSDISELSSLGALSEVDLGNNHIVDALPLAELQALDMVDLTNNQTLRCPKRQALLRVVALHLPSHCN